jgi:hypothetical protein
MKCIVNKSLFHIYGQKSRFTLDMLFSSGLIIEEWGGLAQMSVAEWQSSKQSPRISAEFQAGIKCDRRK